MAKQARAADGLVKVQRELASWRERHGGRGRSIPTGLWSAAAEVAAVQGVSATASALGVSRARLARRLQERSAKPAATSAPVASFVEVDAQRVFAAGRTVVRIRRVSGEQVEIEVEGGSFDVTSLARSLWECAR
jgi:DNA-binding phage protein